ncbi:acetyltransferase [Salinibacterium sp. dk2585]|uniref:acetyltransferase n=1 Tax=unclassified Salinibacterium TaxID=2632331 RepID=UPI0011C2582F|nr:MULTISPECIES: acetyltransferase [unclassified Salinibacterium]QEE60844.1 acetyltransferase [Salinibacterium sp. dk2585]TXK55916.1 acetyltransferase [Salinibacterium sp. dk5596]
MTQPLIVVGAGGFGRETLDVIDAINRREQLFDLLGVLDSGPSEFNRDRLQERGVAYLGRDVSTIAERGARFVVSIGAPNVRATVTDEILALGVELATLVHPNAVIGSVSTIGAGSVICSGVQVSTNVALGRSVHLNPNATIGHDVTLGAYVSVNPGAIISGNVTVGSRSLIGAGAVVLQGLQVGADSTVGAAACVVRNVAERRIVRGVPAR